MIAFKRQFATSALAISLLSAGGLATAAAEQNPLVATVDQLAQLSVSDADLLAFARASAPLEEIQAKYQGLAQNVQSEEQMQQLQQQANEEMIAAVEQTELSVEQYNAMVSLLQTDKQAQERFMELVRQNGG
jgi:hypothetical protein